MSTFPQIWITDELQPRELLVRGVAAVDPDCLVAFATGRRKAVWIIRDNGRVIGFKDPANDNEVKAKRKGT